MLRTFAIGEVAARAGLRPSTLRYYESIGLLPEPPRRGGQRRYDESVFERLDLIRVGRAAGLSLTDIDRLFTGFPSDAPAAERWRTLAYERLPELDALIARAQAMRDRLLALGACRCADLSECAHAAQAGTD